MEPRDDPPTPGDEGLDVSFGLTEYLDLLDDLAKKAICPICGKNKGWARPPGIERLSLTTTRESKETLEALPFVCNYCGFIRAHLVSGYRDR